MKPYNTAVHYEIWGNTIQSSTNVQINQVSCIVKSMLKNNDIDNDKLQCFTEKFNFSKL